MEVFITGLGIAQPGIPVLDWRGSKAALLQAGLIATAVILPSVCHLCNAPVRYFLPMHWPVILAGLVYGWRGGLAVGFFSPLASFALSGMPPAILLPVMCAEIAAYGFAAGFLRQNLRLNGYIAALGAVVAGRIIYTAIVFVAFHVTLNHVFTALLPGLVAALTQIALLPGLAKTWTEKGTR